MGILNDLLGKVKSVESGLTTGETIGDVLLNYRDDIIFRRFEAGRIFPKQGNRQELFHLEARNPISLSSEPQSRCAELVYQWKIPF